MCPRIRHRDGMALPMTLMAIVLIGIMVSGAFFVSAQEYRIGRGSLFQSRAAAAAEYGATATIAGWSNTRNQSLVPGDTVKKVYSLGGFTFDTVTVTKLNNYTYSLVSDGTVGTSSVTQARRRLGALLRLAYLTIDYRGAVTAAGPLEVGTGAGSTALVNGVNEDPNYNASADICTYQGQDTVGVAAADAAQVTTANLGTITTGSGLPVKTDPLAALPATYTTFGGETWATLTAGANVRLDPNAVVSPQPVVSGTTCVYNTTTNWGDIDHSKPCWTYYPVIYAKGDLTVGNGVGQGVLLVEGNLTITGNFKFVGVVVVQKFITASGLGNDINGAVLIGGTPATPPGRSTLGGDTKIRKSTCAVELASRGSAYLTPIKDRSWADMF
jgi:hypothetical protein